jgi:ABC-2 type transport system permease protein
LGLTGLGFCIAWRLDSTQGFHGVMNLFLIPMWMLSGSLFPAATAKPWLRAVMAVNPVSYGVAALQHCLAPAQAARAGLPPLACCLAVLAAFAAAAAVVSALTARRTAAG